MTLIAVDVEALALCPQPSASQGRRRLRSERAAHRSLTGLSLPRCKRAATMLATFAVSRLALAWQPSRAPRG
jgi:hypothetical protein